MKARFASISILFIGMFFLLASIAKLYNPSEAELALYSLDISPPWPSIIVTAVTTLELGIGISMLLKLRVRQTLALAGYLILAFTGYLWYLSTLSHPPSCGCLGLTGIFENNRHAAIFGMFRNAALMAALFASYRLLGSKRVAELGNKL